MYYIIEGGDGSGKDTQADLLTQHLRNQGQKVLRVNEPDSTLPTGALLRSLLKSGEYMEAHALLFVADRMALQQTKILPALKRGEHVVSVRSWLSTLVYQQEHWPLAWLAALHAQMPCKADRLFLLDVPTEVGLDRVRRRQGVTEVYETRDIQERCRLRYLTTLSEYGSTFLSGGFHVLNADRSVSEIQAEMRELVDASR